MTQIKAGSIDQTIYVVLVDSTTKARKTGLVYNSAGAKSYYTRTRSAAASITLATLAAATSAHADGGFKEVDATNAPGLYRLDIPDAVIASGVPKVYVQIEFTGVDPETIEIELTGQANGIPANDSSGYIQSILANDDHGGASATLTLNSYANFKADISSLATQASVNSIGANVILVLADTDELQTNQGNWLTATGFSTHDAAAVVAAIGDVYQAKIDFSDDNANSLDEYTVQWFKNGLPITTGITSPTIQVIKRADGTDLIAAAAMTQVGSSGAYKYDESTNRITSGEAVIVHVEATIDSANRAFRQLISRDSVGA